MSDPDPDPGPDPDPDRSTSPAWRRFLFAPADDAGPFPARLWIVHFAGVLAMLGLGFTFVFQQLQYHWNWSAPWRYRALFWQGWINTVLIATGALLLSTVFGALTALANRSRFLPGRALARLYVELIRGTPLLVQILVFFYVVTPAFKVGNRYLVGLLTLSLFAGAYLAEIIRAGIDGIGRSQWEAARSLGLTRRQTYRLVVLPQALRQILPPMAGQFVSLIKDSSLLSVIGIAELSLNAQQVNSLTYSSFESYLPLALGYLVLTLPLSLWARHLERRTHFDT